MNLTNISKSTPIEPEINADGWYAQCIRCWHEIAPTDNICPKCKQAQDWSWFDKTKKSKGGICMNKINLKGVTTEAVTGVLILLVALINATLQMFSINTLPIENEEVSNIISTVFLIVTAIWNTWKNRNITTISQEMQVLTDAVKNGEVLEEEIQALISKIKK